MTGACVVLVTAPDEEVAARICRGLVEEGLAACGTIVPRVRSVYRWEGEVHDESEALIVLKTDRARVPEVVRRVPDVHPVRDSRGTRARRGGGARTVPGVGGPRDDGADGGSERMSRRRAGERRRRQAELALEMAGHEAAHEAEVSAPAVFEFEDRAEAGEARVVASSSDAGSSVEGSSADEPVGASGAPLPDDEASAPHGEAPSSEELLDQARAAAGSGRNDAAVRLYRRLVAMEPRNSTVRTELGALLDRVELRDLAVEHYHAAVEIDPSDPDALAGLGAALTSASRFDEAEAQLRRAHRMGPVANGRPSEPGDPPSSAAASTSRPSTSSSGCVPRTPITPRRTLPGRGVEPPRSSGRGPGGARARPGPLARERPDLLPHGDPVRPEAPPRAGRRDVPSREGAVFVKERSS